MNTKSLGSVGRALLLFFVMAASLALWWPSSKELHIAWDDLQMMAVSRKLVAGYWERLLEPQDVHIVPVFRLVRLYFDLHFPARFQWMHAVTLTAHLASTALLFGLSSQYLRTAWGPLTVACLFAWNGLGAEAVIVKSANTYVLSLPFILGAFGCLCRLASSTGRFWAVACFLCLFMAAGLHSAGAILTIPGILLGYYLLDRKEATRVYRRYLLRWAAAGALLTLGCAVWAGRDLQKGIAALSRRIPFFRDPPASLPGILLSAWEVLQGVVMHFGYLIWQAAASRWLLSGLTLGLVVLLVILRHQRSSWWLLTGLALTAVPIIAILILRGPAGYDTSRYCYQSFLVVAVAAGCAVDAILVAAKGQIWPAGMVLLLVWAAPWYYRSQKRLIVEQTKLMRFSPALTPEFWFGWASFFDQADSRAQASRQFRVPPVELDPTFTMGTTHVFAACNPKGKRRILMLAPEQVSVEDCVSFWRMLHEIKEKPSPFDKVSLPASLALLTSEEPVPAGHPLVCRVATEQRRP